LHRIGCDIEQCPNCGLQLISCDCPADLVCHRLPWSGEWPGEEECREFGWYAQMVSGVGWVPCDRDDAGANPDLNRLSLEAEWDPLSRRFIQRQNPPPQERDSGPGQDEG
jgi:hypothetical protein